MISERQNEGINIKRLAAQGQLYNRAKQLHLVHILSAPFVLLVAIIVAILKSAPLMRSVGANTIDAIWFLGVISIFVLVVDQWALESSERDLKSLAAGIQEEFDCDVFQLQWNDELVPKHPSRESILANAEYYVKSHGDAGFRNWYDYPDNEFIPLTAARVICQRSNVSWDADLRGKYMNLVLATGAVASALVLIVGLMGDMSLRGLIRGIIPLLPIVAFIISEVKQNRIAITGLHEIRDAIEKQWQEILAGNVSDSDLAAKSRRLQDRIYMSRKGSPLIPKWIYDKLKAFHESLMVETAEQMKQEYLGRSYVSEAERSGTPEAHDFESPGK